MQAVSGAGYPGIPAMDILGNVVPYIDGEEEKMEWEPRKMLGSLQEESVILADLAISAHANRVPVVDGHMLCLSVELATKAAIDEVGEALRSYAATGQPTPAQRPAGADFAQGRARPAAAAPGLAKRRGHDHRRGAAAPG